MKAPARAGVEAVLAGVGLSSVCRARNVPGVKGLSDEPVAGSRGPLDRAEIELGRDDDAEALAVVAGDLRETSERVRRSGRLLPRAAATLELLAGATRARVVPTDVEEPGAQAAAHAAPVGVNGRCNLTSG